MVQTIENKFLKITTKASGAELVSVKNKKNDREYLWQGDPAFWARRAPVLFPIVGKVNNNTYKIDGVTYDMPQHGLARNAIFEVKDRSDCSISYILKANEESLKVYPFKFELIISYELKDNSLSTKYEVNNADNKDIVFSIGGHPGFNCPLLPGEKFSDYYFEFEKEENASRLLAENGLFTGATEQVLKNETIIPLTDNTFDKDALVFKGLKSEKIYLKSKRSEYFLSFSFKGFPYLALWSKGGGAPFVCIEPWFGLADKVGFEGELKEKEGVLSLGTGETFSCEYVFSVGSES